MVKQQNPKGTNYQGTYQGTAQHADRTKRHPPDLSLDYPDLLVFKELLQWIYKSSRGQSLYILSTTTPNYLHQH